MEYEKTETSENTGNKSKIAFVFGIFMVMLYLVMGFVLLFTDIFAWQLPEIARIVIGILFIVYGGFRVYRLFKK